MEYGKDIFLTYTSNLSSSTDTVYACQDRKDDVKAGVHSTAVLFGDYVSAFLNMNAVLFVSLLVVVGIINEQGPLYYAISCMGTACWLLWQSLNLELDNPASCWSKFFYIPFACIIAHGWVPQMPLWATVDLDG